MMKSCEEGEPKRLDNIAHEIEIMHSALVNYRESLRQFYYSSRAGDWLQAEQHRQNVLSYMESSMDAYTRSCRAQFKGIS